MIEYLRKMATSWGLAFGMALVTLVTGCQSSKQFSNLPPESKNTFAVGDLVTVSFIPLSGETMPPHTERVHEDGTIVLSLIGPVTALGKTAGELQKDIHDKYVPRYYPELTVIVASEARYYYIDGEVRSPGQKEYPGQMTLAKAISVAGGFTDFAKKTKVRVTRGRQSEIVNGDKAIYDPSYDIPIYPGDKIYVPRRFW